MRRNAVTAALEEGRPARAFPPARPKREVAAEAFLLTARPLLYVANVDEAQIGNPGPLVERFATSPRPRTAGWSCCRARSKPSWPGFRKTKRAIFAPNWGSSAAAWTNSRSAAYDLLGLMTFLTAGEKEVRAWTIPRGTKAPEAAGRIHGDIERGFIRAEIVSYDDYVAQRTMEALKAAGLVRSEGREYVMREGDVVNFRFNV